MERITCDLAARLRGGVARRNPEQLTRADTRARGLDGRAARRRVEIVLYLARRTPYARTWRWRR